MADYDLVVRGGRIFDGNGGEPFLGDVAVSGGQIVAVGEVAGTGREEIDAAGKMVTPGFVDIHTHYDGQVTWEHRLTPSSIHGVTTVVMGNCGVGFAPCRSDDRQSLVELMEGVEDIPEVVMTTGLPWNWETFPEYLDVVGSRNYDVDVAAYLPHSCVRVYVMGERGLKGEDANAADLAVMTELTEEAMRAGAMGFATSRSIFHRDRNGAPIPTKETIEPELEAVGKGMKAAGHGVLEALIDYDNVNAEFGLLRRVAERNDVSLTFTVSQLLDDPTGWERALELIGEANDDGLNVKGQVIGRPTGLMLGLNLSFNPFSLNPAYQAIAGLPLAEKVALMRQPETRARIIADVPTAGKLKMLDYLHAFHRIYPLGDPPNYAPPPETSVAAVAERLGVSTFEVAYDMLLENDGNAILFVPVGNYADGNLDAVTRLLIDDNTIMGLGDGGAHYGVICDAAYPTFMMTYWARDKEGTRLPLPRIIKGLTRDTADFIGLRDRGRLAPGYKADINVIDFDRLHLHAPRPVFDLPANGRRLIQDADGYVATMVSGQITYRDGKPTQALPGALVRGPQASPN